jgi:hypothetical protein
MEGNAPMHDSPAAKNAIHRLIADSYRRSSATETPAAPLSRNPLADEYAILPPYLGEFGFEVRFFLGAVEPWLRNGWSIPARRPELYPPGAAFLDPVFFAHIDELKDRFGGTEVLLGLSFGTSPQPWKEVKKELRGKERIVTIESVDDAFYRKLATIERAIRQAVKSRYFHAFRQQTPWDYPLTSVHVPWAPALSFPVNTLVPTYKPAAFSIENPAVGPHVGVQLRNVPAKPERNTDVARILPLVQSAANYLKLPIICYGHPEGTLPAPGAPTTFELAGGTSLLAFELGALAKCRLLFAPETGIANLAGWLQVPTLLESQLLAYEYESLRPFNPRIDVIDYSAGIEGQIDRLLADKVRLPAAENAQQPRSFLHPAYGLPAEFRDEFDL